MPAVIAEMGPMTIEQKRVLVKKITAAVSEVSGLPANAIFVFVKENSLDNVGVGGVLVSEAAKYQESK